MNQVCNRELRFVCLTYYFAESKLYQVRCPKLEKEIFENKSRPLKHIKVPINVYRLLK